MPFTMTHLIIADRISHIFAGRVKNLPSFYLGNLAPDAVHNRARYISDYKKASHLYAGPEPWGMIIRNDEWQGNVVRFLHTAQTPHPDFILGYACHLLADINSNIKLWIPFKQKHAVDMANGYGNQYHRESGQLDDELALSYERSDFYWQNIRESFGIDIPGVIYAEEIEKQKDNILNVWYAEKERPDIKAHTIVTYETTMAFIADTVDMIADVFNDFFP